MTQTSIGSGPNRGGNENPGTDPGAKTFGENAPPREPPAGADALDPAAPDVPAGVPGAPAKPGVKKGPESFPDGPNVENSPWEPDAARGNPPRR
ncbi:hypothetical protein [Ramlibacter rhizophilus]|uniref:Uncharacterized protein n=1 Tax=Ramlibacter rhizophilus TaxID=1781167 RepID=A0A4Z0C2Z9_9BURK|nr:hypothetical protein [Ramlibacter rhizophilus]TFZ04868.1 hypothetical protein EZ242_03735 [Ramlibacter rhizophilus]